ncbi:MAG TPA: hydroxyacylglutathione hydrolase [Aquabacterium sp.]|nr:hydroxyacylglutathione hydrolase [Aquabacterium sp.]
MELLALPAFADNYIWMIHDGAEAIVVDPGEASPVIRALEQHGLTLVSILVTHRHADHVGGIRELRPLLQGPIYGPDALAPEYVDHVVREGDTFSQLDLTIKVWETPGHTAEHISYICDVALAQNDLTPILFCGDTLFSAGCGRLFDGHPEWLLNTLKRLAQLPDQTKICCAHEYTLSNLAFAKAVEPGNSTLAEFHQHCLELRGRNLPTLPTTLSIERQVNPFLRLNEPEIISSVKQHGDPHDDALAVLTALRAWKNTF